MDGERQGVGLAPAGQPETTDGDAGDHVGGRVGRCVPPGEHDRIGPLGAQGGCKRLGNTLGSADDRPEAGHDQADSQHTHSPSRGSLDATVWMVPVSTSTSPLWG